MQVAGVQYILDTVVASLAANADRKFTFAEMVKALVLAMASCYLLEDLLQNNGHTGNV